MTPFTLERYRIVELYAELLHCSNMSLLNRPASFSHMYDVEGRLQGGLAGLEELAQVIALNNNNEQGNDSMDEEHDQVNHALEFPVRNPSDSSPSLDSDESMSDSGDEPGSSDDEAMEEIAMDEPLSPIPFAQPLPQVSVGVASSPENLVGSPDSRDERSPVNTQTHGSSPDSQSSGMTSRTSGSGRGSRRSSRSRRRLTLESSRESLLPIGEHLKLCLLNENVLTTLIVSFGSTNKDKRLN